MKKTLLFVAVMIFAMTCNLSFAKDYEVTKNVGDLAVFVAIDKNPPVTGDNKITVAIKDAAGKPVTDASVAVDYGMPAMPGMGAMSYKTTTAPKGDKYLATLNFSMAGPWYVSIKITRAGKTQTARLNIDIR